MCGQLFQVVQIILIKTVLFFADYEIVLCFVTEAYTEHCFLQEKLSIKHVVFNSLVNNAPL